MEHVSIINQFFFLWSIFIPITSILMIPFIKGSLISYILSFLSIVVVIFFKKTYLKYYCKDLFYVFLLWLFFLFLSQIANYFYNISLANLELINKLAYNEKIFRSSLFTQSIYLIPGILMYLYAKYFYNIRWDKWIIRSGIFFVLYGFYKWGFFLIFGSDGDFLTNRVVENGLEDGYLYQLITIGNITMQRLQSLTGEPSFFAFTILPYFIYALQKKSNIFVIILFAISLILSTSTTAYIGLAILGIYYLVSFKKNLRNIKSILFFIIIMSLIYIFFMQYINDIFKFMIIDKIVNPDMNVSSIDRIERFLYNIDYWMNLDIFHEMIGIGFGYIRSTDLFTTILINTGFIGFCIWSYFFLIKGFTFKIKSKNDFYNNSILLVLYIVTMTSVPEFSFIHYWLFVGIIINQQKIRAEV